MVEDKGVPVVCCGEKMTELKANTSDGAKEKHVPDVSVSGDVLRVKVGSVEHPMAEAHYIEWIAAETESGISFKYLKPGVKPEAEFPGASAIVAVYDYCNLHGLWKKEI